MRRNVAGNRNGVKDCRLYTSGSPGRQHCSHRPSAKLPPLLLQRSNLPPIRYDLEAHQGSSNRGGGGS